MYQNTSTAPAKINLVVARVLHRRPYGRVDAERKIRTILRIQLVLYYPRIAQAEGEHNRYRMKNVHSLTIS